MTLSLTDLVYQSEMKTSDVNNIFAEIENYFNGVTLSADITLTGTITGNTLTDGTMSITGGDITGVGTIESGAITSTGAIQGASITDGTATLSSGTLTGLVSATMTGALTVDSDGTGNAINVGNVGSGIYSSLNSSGLDIYTASIRAIDIHSSVSTFIRLYDTNTDRDANIRYVGSEDEFHIYCDNSSGRFYLNPYGASFYGNLSTLDINSEVQSGKVLISNGLVSSVKSNASGISYDVLNIGQVSFDQSDGSYSSVNVMTIDSSQRVSLVDAIGINGTATSTSPLNITGIPTSAAGLVSGDVWSNSGVLTIV